MRYLVKGYPKQQSAEYADQHRGANSVSLQDGDDEDAGNRKLGGMAMQVAERDSGRRAGDDNAGIAQSDECNEQADASGHGGVELVWNCGEQTLPDSPKRKQ